ncbi:MAG: T9SS type A sorting domain-containing protein [FCB group bacterium]|nr:T9SS type A sorting domain-containing protein [FCB group bacterium]
MKRLPLIMLTVFCIFSPLQSQTIVLKPYGISPRDAVKDDADIFDRAYNGLLNVGTETKMYFEGHFADSSFTSPTWSIIFAPTGSSATISSPEIIDDATQIVSFIPDVEGIYVIELAEGTVSNTITINAGTYVGVSAGTAACELCHNDKFTEWQGTGHYAIFEEKMTSPGYYASYCIKCHTTGYDSKAANNGFDDRKQYVPIYGVDTTFVFPGPADLYDFYGSSDSTRYPGVWDSLLVFFPNSMELARIQCESCHGPGSAHSGVTADSRMVSTLSADNCAYCHDSGTHHVFPEQWDASGHAKVPPYPAGTRNSCRGCHNGAQFIQYVNGEEITPQPPTNITCATCHDPHSDENEHQLRTTEVTLSNGKPVTMGGNGKLCMNCHQSRREANSYSDEPHKHYGPHYVPQADMLIGTNAVTFGKKLPTSPHLTATENSCVDCHMYPGHVDENDNVIMVGSHTFSMTQGDTLDNVAACAGCHGDIGANFSDKKYYVNGNADHDGDGVEEGLQDEVSGLLDQLAALLPHPDTTAGYDPQDNVDDTWTRTELKAAYNFEMVYYDRSYGIHNPAFTVALLKVSIQALLNNAIDGEIVAIDDVPNDQGKQIKIIWDKFVDDGVALDPITSYTVKRYDEYDDTWTGVGEHTADGSARYALVVPTLFDSTADGVNWTTFKVVAVSGNGTVHESLPAKGYSIDNLIPQAPVNMMVSVSNSDIELTWEAPDDPDINFYRIFRSTEPNFPVDETTEIATTTDLSHYDTNMETGTYYYIVAAVDFSGNLGEPSTEVSAEILSTSDEMVPLTYGLSQNYPNPFNPVTTINFSIPNSGDVHLIVYDALGREVTKLINREMKPGHHSVSFNGDNLPTGLYFYTIIVNDFTDTKKMLLLK